MAGQAVTSVMIVGVGGQGTLLTSRVLARVAVKLGHDVKVSEVHGMAQRGGSVVSQVRFGPKVYSPIIKRGDADIVLAFEKLEAARWLGYLKQGGLLIINDERVDPLPVMSGETKYPEDIAQKLCQVVPNSVLVDATGIAVGCGSAKAANMVLVGLLSSVMDIDPELVEEAIRELVSPAVLDLNLRAFHEGRAFWGNRASTANIG
ncbi:MAG: indolepyruvate oxidoreductase subunit beta [Syntrophothermus sp.]|uniref:indolepyruvate oxidoreductase subunit beta n=1 Tax=Syntrophothermus sp. TaxID=2736299 RepID=UPI00257D65BC|nr:indolepyruvate oxidoreductase subunit beta [Syntrophothermus sp.]NSW83401.1 indolepyruvate oxidoreductase subunit beta [Syntrophothermus sp.]